MPRFIADSSLSASIEVVYANGDGEYEDLFNKDLFNKDLIELRLARTASSHACHRECERRRRTEALVLAPAMTLELPAMARVLAW